MQSSTPINRDNLINPDRPGSNVRVGVMSAIIVFSAVVGFASFLIA